MKKWFLALAACALALTLAACGGKQGAQVQPANLTKSEQVLVELVEAGGNTKLFDITLPEGAQWLDISAWTLQDGQWQDTSVMGGVPGGRLCLRVDDAGELIYASVGGATSRLDYGDIAPYDHAEGSAWTNSWLEKPAPLALDTDTPVYLYLESADGTLEAFGPDAFAEPEKLAGYARVTAVTIRPTSDT